MGLEKLRTQKHMSQEEFEKFEETLTGALKELDIAICNEAEELELRSIATAMWDAGRHWEHNKQNK